jgi:hypothetical protein
VADFAEHVGINHRRAKLILKKLDREMDGRLLIPSNGKNQRYTFVRSVLQKAHPEYFESVESLEQRVEELEDRVDELHAMMKRIAVQVGANTRGIEAVREAMKRPLKRVA